ncbi:hypothetical protein Tco_0989757 [Tanacetum coccineum]|uniref:Uncharacterized protein n=1 Tax=Tanacetum coccineum TaxID=301880 RepID=A0ABQ5EUI2_9ASTR
MIDLVTLLSPCQKSYSSGEENNLHGLGSGDKGLTIKDSIKKKNVLLRDHIRQSSIPDYNEYHKVQLNFFKNEILPSNE